ncbi:tetratricopeptide repeat protein [Halomonas campisalis]|uniref:Tetratricopeptide repeat protein n=1 Tax=Billgrantia campisalis TaxID=74661 RepID=A0ABS9P4J2_9GAMM|nr:tetratricopeptide repeat protein [Halomonas campisalis]MCG6656516.1 tetratricopeptide repeat protein [Halomonas campisalis]MDR5861702.1 tetratricopeptide repeat protein [Halomonas campisalis]
MPSSSRSRAPIPHLRHGLAGLGLALLLGGCQALPPQLQPAETGDPLDSAPPIERGLDADGLATLLTAELAGQRGDYRRAASGYRDMAERYHSPALAERATLAARFSSDPLLLEEVVQHWQRLAPQAEAPSRLLASLAMQRGDWTAALEQRLQLVERGGHGDLTNFVERALEANTDLLPLRERLAEHLTRPADGAPRHDAELAMAMLEAATGQTRRAEARLDALAREHAELPALWLTRAQLALDSGQALRARDAARRGLEVAPQDPRFILLLAQAELALGNVAAAEAHTDALLERHEGGHDMRMALANLYLENNQPEPARRLLLPLVSDERTPAMVYFLLGAIAEQESEVDNALLYYRQVAPGSEFLMARLRAARMLIEDDRLLDARAFLRIERLRHGERASELVSLEVELLDELGQEAEAAALLDRELARAPNDERLLYQRAMRAWRSGDVEAMERDLARIIEHDPDNAMALNALGYTLADLNIEGRLEEAREMIERAHELDPGNAAIMDSLGWVYFRLGEPERALPWLERAYAAMPDQEIAAHLVEVLWVLDRHDEAHARLEQALERYDDRPQLDELLERIPELAP